MKELLVIILLIALVIIVAVRRATDNFKSLEMGAYFKLTAREASRDQTISGDSNDLR